MPRWAEDYQDSADSILPSFPALRQKTLQTLYAAAADSNNITEEEDTSFRDKSPKGSVDEAIQPLVDLINQHSSFATLSSCSGRISLFDPTYHHDNHQSDHAPQSTMIEDQQLEATSTVAHGGKGSSGGWVVVSHDPISPEMLINALTVKNNNYQKDDDPTRTNQDASSSSSPPSPATTSTPTIPWNLQFEPMMLHVAAANLARGQQLFQLAYQHCGFRESGLVVTDARVTVAIRTTATSLTIPVLPSEGGAWALSKDYLRHFCQLANERLRQTHQSIQALLQAFQQECLQPILLSISIRPSSSTSLPDLQLWGHASVYYHGVDDDSSGGQQDQYDKNLTGIWVFGGYGVGPHGNGGPRRSAGIYRLAQHEETDTNILTTRRWGSTWETIHVQSSSLSRTKNPDSNDDAIRMVVNGISCTPVEFTPREGLSGIGWYDNQRDHKNNNRQQQPTEQPTVILFGGRTSPANPLNELILFHLPSKQFLLPSQVRGTPPTPRWGHTFTRIQQQPDGTADKMYGTILGVVHGGRNEQETFHDTFILSLIQDDEGRTGHSAALLWTPLLSSNHDGTRIPRPRFHHATCQISDIGQILMVGGLSNASGLFGQSSSLKDEISLFHHDDESSHFSLLDWTKSEPPNTTITSQGTKSSPFIHFGHSAHWIKGNEHHGDLLLLAGGISETNDDGHDHDSGDSSEMEPLLGYEVVKPGREEMGSKSIARKDDSSTAAITLERIHVHHLQQHPNSIPWGSLVHHTSHLIPCIMNSNEKTPSSSYELVLVGGGVPGFAFGPQFAVSQSLIIQVDSDKALRSSSSTPGQQPHHFHNKNKKSIHDHASHSFSAQNKAGAGSDAHDVPVVYASKRDAKRLRDQLDAVGYLDKLYRMGPAAAAPKKDDDDTNNNNNTNDLIAIPISDGLWNTLSNEEPRGESYDSWMSLIHSTGRRPMALSSAAFAAGKKSSSTKKK